VKATRCGFRVSKVDRAGVLLSMQRALLGRVTVDLRAVVARWSERTVDAVFMYDRPVDAFLELLVSEAETYAVADWPLM
jgi:hypothetical protein